VIRWSKTLLRLLAYCAFLIISVPPGVAGEMPFAAQVEEYTKHTEEMAEHFSPLIAKKQFSAAIAEVNTLLAKKEIDNDPQLYLWRGNTYWSICDYRAAIADFDHALRLNSETIDALIHKGICQARLGELEDCAATFKRAANLAARLEISDSAQIKIIAQALLEREQKKELLAFIADLRKSDTQQKNTALIDQLDQSVQAPARASDITRIDKITAGLTSVLATPHFVFLSDIDKFALERYAAQAEGFLKYVDLNLFPVEGNYPVSVFILHNKESERAFLKNHMNFPHHVHGAYISSRNVLVTYDGAGVGTFFHEIMHKVLENETHLEFWAEEGIPAFFEKVYGALAPQLILEFGFPENWYPQMLKSKGSQLTLPDIIKKANHADPGHEDQQRLVALFLNQNHHLKDYLKLTRAGDKKGYKTYVEAAFEKPIAELAPLFRKYLDYIANDSEIQHLPASLILDSAELIPNTSPPKFKVIEEKDQAWPSLF